jgi:hypothetical protein
LGPACGCALLRSLANCGRCTSEVPPSLGLVKLSLLVVSTVLPMDVSRSQIFVQASRCVVQCIRRGCGGLVFSGWVIPLAPLPCRPRSVAAQTTQPRVATAAYSWAEPMKERALCPPASQWLAGEIGLLSLVWALGVLISLSSAPLVSTEIATATRACPPGKSYTVCFPGQAGLRHLLSFEANAKWPDPHFSFASPADVWPHRPLVMS